MKHYYAFGPMARRLAPPLAALGLLLAPAGAAQAQTPATFAPLATYATGGSLSLRVVSADLNGDNRPDAVTANITSNNVSVLLNSGSGAFATAVRYNVAPTGVQVQGLTLGDINADGRLDIVTANNGDNTVSVLLGQAGGTFGAYTSYPTGTSTEPRNAALADLNGDGRLDIVTGNSASASVSVLLAQAGGGFVAPVQYATSGQTFDVALGDVTGDGRPDIVAPSYATNSVNVLPGVAGGTFGTFTNYPTGTSSQSVAVRLGDLNNDGRLDIVVGNQNTTVSVLLGQAGGTLATPVNYASGITSVYAVAIGDVNGDNRPDLIAGNFQGAVIGILLGKADGTFAAVTTYNGGSGSQGVTLADVNNDGRPDVLTANRNDNTLGVLLNTSTFTAPFLTGISPTNGPVGTSVTLTGTRLTGATAVSFNGTAASTFSVVNDGTITATVPTGATTGNVTVTTSAGTSNGLAFTVNPTVVISSTAGTSGGSTGTTPIPFTATFSQSVTGFTPVDVSVTNGTVTSFSGSGTTYTFTVEPTTAGTATTVSVPAGVAQTTAGTGNVASSAPFSLTYNAPVTVTYWQGTVSTDWFTTANWSDGVPTSTMDAIIPTEQLRYPVLTGGTANVRSLNLYGGSQLTQTGGTLNLSGSLTNDGEFLATGGLVSLTGGDQQTLGGGSSSFRFWDLTVGPSTARLTNAVQVQRVLTLNGNLRSDGNLTLLSNATGTAMVVDNNGNRVTGNATVQRYIDPSLNSGLGYRHYGMPIVDAVVGSLATTGFTPIVNPDYNTVGNTVTPFPNVYGYNESRITGANATTQAFDYGYYSPEDLNSPLSTGVGFTVNINAGATVAVSGELTSGNFEVEMLTRGSEANSGWQLLGNPYPAPLDWKLVRLNLPAGVNDAVYVYKSSGQYDGSYQFYQNGFGTLPNGLISQMQGFFLRVTQTVPFFTFQNAWRTTSYEAPAFNRATAETRPAVQLDLVSAQGTHEPAYVYFEAGATAGIDDHYDAEKLPNTTGLNLSSAAAGTALAVNGLPLLDGAAIVPLHVGVPTTGTYTLQAASLLNLSATDVYLHDAVTGQRINLKQQSSYSFTASNAALITDRFSLHFGAQRPLSAQGGFTAASVSVYPNPAHAQFTLLLPAVSGATQAKVALCNVLGQAVRETTVALPAAGARTIVDVQNLPAGVYVLRVQAGTATVTKQVIVD